jgi:phosphatidylinositol-3-phosphatase
MNRRNGLGRAIGLLLAGLFLLGAGCSGASNGTLRADDAASTAAELQRAHEAAPSRPVSKLLVFVVENHSLDQMRIGMPYTFALAEEFGHATNYTAITHPSLPNYIAIVTGQTHGIEDNAGPAANPVEGDSVFGEAIEDGKTAKVYADGMERNCALENGGDDYKVRHNPWVYLVDERDMCEKFDVPVDELDADIVSGDLPNVGMVVPNNCNNSHDCPLIVADRWFQEYMTKIFRGPDWLSGRLAVVLTADEDDESQGNMVLTVVVHPSQRSTIVTVPLSHYSLTRLYSDVADTKRLVDRAAAASMSEEFGLPIADE